MNVHLLLRMIIGIPLLMGLALIIAAGFQVVEPIYDNSQSDAMDGAESQGWNMESTIMLFTTLGMIGLPLTVIVWLIFGDLRDDVRQRRTGFR